jgi:NAD(P)-dependent dehydrogenase (short-subunit alcohol dehydrogenase family)
VRLTEVLAIELAPHHIRVNAVSPGCIRTAPLEPLIAEPAARELFERMAVLNTLGEPDDIVNAAVYLASDEAAFVTGVNLPVDGGSSASGGLGAPDEATEAVIARATERFAHR